MNIFINPIFISYPERINDAKLEEKIEFNFKIRGYPVPEITFQDKALGIIIEGADESNYEIIQISKSETEIEYKFIIKSVKIETSISYECNAKNNFGESKFPFSLNVLKIPELIEKPESIINAIQNSNLLIECKVLSNPEANIICYKNGTKIIASKKVQISETKNQNSLKSYSLKILSIDKDDAGSYVIVANNIVGESKTSTNIIVEFSPILIKDLKPVEKSCENSAFQIECIIIGNPVPEVEWY